jgi:hypothetical protein
LRRLSIRFCNRRDIGVGDGPLPPKAGLKIRQHVVLVKQNDHRDSPLSIPQILLITFESNRSESSFVSGSAADALDLKVTFPPQASLRIWRCWPYFVLALCLATKRWINFGPSFL